MRFHGAGRPDLISRDYAHADLDARVPLLAHLGDRVVAVAGYDRLNEPDAAEVAFAVAEDQQGRGLATQHARAAGRRRGHARDHALRRRGAAREPADAARLRQRRLRRAPRLEPRRHRPPLARPAPDRDAGRAHRRPHARRDGASLRALLAPSSIAVVGATAREGSVGGAIFRGIVEGGFRGVATPVHPDVGVVGLHARRGLAEATSRSRPSWPSWRSPPARCSASREEAARRASGRCWWSRPASRTPTSPRASHARRRCWPTVARARPAARRAQRAGRRQHRSGRRRCRR